MSLTQFVAEVDALLAEAKAAFEVAADSAALELARIEYIGAAKGRLKNVQKGLGAVAKEDKPAAGKRFNEVKAEIESAFAVAKTRVHPMRLSSVIHGQVRLTANATAIRGSLFDITLPGERLRL